MLQASPLRACFFSVFLAVLAVAALRPAQAQATRGVGDLFTVSGIAVDASAESAAAARPLALAGGQRRAFTQLLRRLTLPEDHDRLPQPTEALQNAVIAGFDISEERTSATRYIARINVQFRPDAVRRLLQDNRLPYSETRSRPVLVIPVWQSPEGNRLWESDNPWRNAWTARPAANGLVPLVMAETTTGAGEDAPDLDRLLGNPAELRAFAGKRGHEDVLVLSATLQQQEPGNVRVEIFPYHDGAASFLDRLEVYSSAGGTIEEALIGGAIEIERRIETRWKRATVFDLEKQGQLSAAAVFGSLPEWTKLRATLAAMPVIRKVDVLRLSHRDAQVLIDYYGDPGQLSVALAQRDVKLEQQDGFWILRSRQP